MKTGSSPRTRRAPATPGSKNAPNPRGKRDEPDRDRAVDAAHDDDALDPSTKRALQQSSDALGNVQRDRGEPDALSPARHRDVPAGSPTHGESGAPARRKR